MLSKILKAIWDFICLFFDISGMVTYFSGSTSLASGGGAMIGWLINIPREWIYFLIFACATSFIIAVISILVDYRKWNKLSDLRVKCFDISVLLQKMGDEAKLFTDNKVKNIADREDSLTKALECFGSIVMETDTYKQDIKRLFKNNKSFSTKTNMAYLEKAAICFDKAGIGLEDIHNNTNYQILDNQLLELKKLIDDKKLDMMISDYKNYSRNINILTIFTSLSFDQTNSDNSIKLLPLNIEKELQAELRKIKKSIVKFWKT